jgi:hypothetical protein
MKGCKDRRYDDLLRLLATAKEDAEREGRSLRVPLKKEIGQRLVRPPSNR